MGILDLGWLGDLIAQHIYDATNTPFPQRRAWRLLGDVEVVDNTENGTLDITLTAPPVTGEPLPIPNTIAERGDAGELYATSQVATDGTRVAALSVDEDEGGVVTSDSIAAVLARSGDTRIALTGSGVIAMQRWVSGDWQNKNRFVSRANGTLGVESDDGGGGVGIWTDGERHSETAKSDEVVLSAEGLALYATDSDGRVVALNRSQPVLTSSGTATLAYDYHHVISGSATPSTLPAATANDVGLELWVSNRTGSPITVTRAGADTVDGSTGVVLRAGQSARLECVAAGSWRAHVIERSGSSTSIQYGDAGKDAFVHGAGVALQGGSLVRLAANTVHCDVTDSSGTFLCSANAPMRIQPQQATSGAGRDLTIGGGPGQTPGTNIAGKVVVDLGASVSNASATVDFVVDSARVGYIRRLNSTYNFQLVGTTSIDVRADAGSVFMSGSSIVVDTSACHIRGTQFINQRPVSNQNAQRLFATSTTTGTTSPTVVANIETDDNATIVLELRLIGRRSGSGAFSAIRRRIIANRDGGVLTIVDTETDGTDYDPSAIGSVAFTTSGANVVVTVTPATSANCRWTTTATISVGHQPL